MSELEHAIAVALELSPQDRERLIQVIQMDASRPPSAEEERIRLIHSIRGKYADVPTSSEDFIRRKHEDLDLED